MAKKFFLAFLIGLTSVFLCPSTLTAADNFLARQPDYDNFNDYMSSKLEEVATADTDVSDTWTGNITESLLPRFNNGPAISVPAAGVAQVNYTITYVIGSAAEYNNISVSPSYSDIYRFQKLVFAHNAANLLGNLSSLTPGEAITITENGVAKSYIVVSTETIPKINNYLNNDPQFINKLAYGANGHSLALLTCAGTMYGNGDASHRLVVYVDAI